MAFMPYLHDYASALEHYHSVKPLRTDANIIPLGPRKLAHEFRMAKGPKSEIQIVAHGCPRITYHSDYTIHVRVEQTVPFGFSGLRELSSVLGANLIIRDKKTWVECATGWIPIPVQEGLMFRRHDNGDLSLAEPSIATRVLRLNRAGMKRMRARFGKFRKYGISMIKLRGDGYMYSEDYVAAFGWVEPPRELPNVSRYPAIPKPVANFDDATQFLTLALSEDEETRYKAFLIGMRGRLLGARSTPDFVGSSESISAAIESFTKTLDEAIIRAFAPEVLEYVEITSGGIFKDPYRKFVSTGMEIPTAGGSLT